MVIQIGLSYNNTPEFIRNDSKLEYLKINNLNKKCVFLSDFSTSVVVLMVCSLKNSPESIGIDFKRENDEKNNSK